MAAINDLLSQIQDPDLRERIQKEVEKLTKQKKFGLVFEEHLPEYTPLYDMPIKVGCNILLKNNKEDKSVYTVLDLKDDIATCCKKDFMDEPVLFSVGDIVRIAEFGEPIYPYLKPIDSVCNAPDSDLWHTLIEADNFHALQLLEYLYAGKVDCIYIDPPYNTGAKDWKYNNDYVDVNDSYRHSKWLSMMEKRLKLANKLLNPKDSVLVVTIDEKEYLHLGCLLEEMFPDARIQMITIVNNPFGQERIKELARVEEYAFFLFIGESTPFLQEDDLLNLREMYETDNSAGYVNQVKDISSEKVRWERLIRGGAEALRQNSPRLFYPVYINPSSRVIDSVGDPISLDCDRLSVAAPEGCVTVWPIKTNGAEGRWRCSCEYLRELLQKGYAKVGAYDKINDRWTILYLSKSTMKRIENEEIEILGYESNGAVILGNAPEKKHLYSVKTVWNRPAHRAGEWGTKFIRNLLPGRSFPYPKSLYAVKDVLQVVTKDKRDALIVDFFAGSGTTLHAVNLLNSEDTGHRRCILVTNNEVSDLEAKTLSNQGLKPGDEEWEQYGIARYVTWPRTVCSIEGHDVNGQPLKGNYLGIDIPMADGFKANAAYFKLGFLDKTSVALGRQFTELLPILWMKAGSVGPCPSVEGDVPDMLILPENKFAVLNEENTFASFKQNLQEYPEIQTVFLVTDYDINYRSMANSLNVMTTYQLYRDYLDNFRINHTRD